MHEHTYIYTHGKSFEENVSYLLLSYVTNAEL